MGGSSPATTAPSCFQVGSVAIGADAKSQLGEKKRCLSLQRLMRNKSHFNLSIRVSTHECLSSGVLEDMCASHRARKGLCMSCAAAGIDNYRQFSNFWAASFTVGGDLIEHALNAFAVALDNVRPVEQAVDHLLVAAFKSVCGLLRIPRRIPAPFYNTEPTIDPGGQSVEALGARDDVLTHCVDELIHALMHVRGVVFERLGPAIASNSQALDSQHAESAPSPR